MKLTDKTLIAFEIWLSKHVMTFQSDSNGQISRPVVFWRLNNSVKFGLLDDFSEEGIDISIVPCFDGDYDTTMYTHIIFTEHEYYEEHQDEVYETKSMARVRAIEEANNLYNSKYGN